MPVGEPWLHPLLQELRDVDLAGDTDDADGHSAALRDIKQIVQQALIPKIIGILYRKKSRNKKG